MVLNERLTEAASGMVDDFDEAERTGKERSAPFTAVIVRLVPNS